MKFRERLLLLLMIQVVGFLCQHSFRKCTKEVSNCPITEELWYKRWNDVTCFGEGLNYTCMMATGGVLVEACIHEYEIRAFTGSQCPYINSCDGIEPVLAIEGKWPLCPEGVFGCPPADHPVYTVYDMYKYPACIVRNVSELSTTTLPQEIMSSPIVIVSNITKDDGSNRRNNGSEILGIIAGVIVFVLSSIIAFCVLKVVRRRKVRRRKKDDHIELCDYPQSTSDGSTPLLKDSRFYEDFEERLLKFSKKVTEKIPLSPVQTFGNLPVDLLYAKVVIKTDAKYVQMGYQYYEDTNLEKETKYIEKPSDLFYKYGKLTERIFMKGNAAHGKTTYCLWLLQHWYHAHSKRTRTQDEWGKEIGNFDFVFLVRLRDVQNSRGNVIDMICKDILGIDDESNINWLKNALKSGNYRSLILIDGLDEWKPDHNIINDNKFKGIPNTDDIKNCVIFISMRPWKFEEVSKDVNSGDRVIEILGLNEKGLRKVTENVLFIHFGLNVEKHKDKLKYDTILNKIKNNTLASILKIPLLAVLCVQMWYIGDELTNSLTRFYSEMINMLIERTREKTTTARNRDYSQNSSISDNNNEPFLLQLRKLAYEWLMAGRYIHEVHTKDMLEEIGMKEPELEFSLNVGLLSKEETDGLMNKTVKLYFFHASLQEYLGAVYIDGNEEIRNSFCDHLSSVKDILQFGNVLVFLTGLDAQLGSEISKRIVNVANNDNEVSKYRKFDKALSCHNNEVELLYKLQASCYRELSDKDALEQPYHVSDVYVGADNDIDTIRATADILAYHFAGIKSLLMINVPTDKENGIPDSLLAEYLDRSVSLQSLYLDGLNTNRTLHRIGNIVPSLTALELYNVTLTPEAFSSLQTAIHLNTAIQTLGLAYIKIRINDQEGQPVSLSGILQILPDLPCLTSLHIQIRENDKPVFSDVLSRLSNLHGIEYCCTSPRDDRYDLFVVQTLCEWSWLRWFCLFNVNLADNGLWLRHDMSNLETVVLRKVDMLPSAWNDFIRSLLKINHEFDIFLWKVNMDEECLDLIRSCPQFWISHDEVADVGTCRHNLQFIRVFPPSE